MGHHLDRCSRSPRSSRLVDGQLERRGSSWRTPIMPVAIRALSAVRTERRDPDRIVRRHRALARGRRLGNPVRGRTGGGRSADGRRERRVGLRAFICRSSDTWEHAHVEIMALPVRIDGLDDCSHRLGKLIATFACARLRKPVAAPSNGRTQVIVFTPTVPNAPAREGYCWTSSIALHRADAWRCMIGNAIEDPCFATPDVSDAVICRANPATSATPAFLLRLDQAASFGQYCRSSIVAAAVAIAMDSRTRDRPGNPQVPSPYASAAAEDLLLAGHRRILPLVDGLALPYLTLGGECRIEAEARRYANRVAQRFQCHRGPRMDSYRDQFRRESQHCSESAAV